MLNGVYEGNSPSALATAEQWLGSNLGAVDAFSGGANWSDFETSIGYEQGLWAGSGKTTLWSIPLFADSGNLKSAAQGAYNAYYVQAAEELLQGQPNGQIYVRTGWEFNSSWEPWSALSDPTDYVTAFQQFVDAFRSVSNRFVFTWTPNIGDQGMNPAAAYPGNAYVDIIGMDFYWETQYDSSNPATAWNTMVNQTYGLNWLAQFAAQQGKPIAIPEWGVESNNAAPYIQQAVAWFNAHGVVYQSYWDSNASYQGQLSEGQYPAAAAAFAAALQTPTVSGIGVAVAGGGSVLGAGGHATITVALSEVVNVNGVPTLTLSDGETAVYTGGSGTAALTFAYTAGAGHNTGDLQVTGLNLPAGASITDSEGNALSGGASADLHLAVNTTPPAISSISASATGGATTLTTGEVVSIAVATSEAVSVNGQAALTLSNGAVATYAGGSGTNELIFTYTVAAGQNVSDLKVTGLSLGSGASISDAAGNALAGIASADLHLAVQTTPPTILDVAVGAAAPAGVAAPAAVSATGGAAALTAGETVSITVATSEAVSVAGSAALTLSNGAVAAYAGGSGTDDLTFTYTVAAGQSASDLKVTGLTLSPGGAITDAAGNALAGTASADLHLSVYAPLHDAFTNDFGGDGKADILWSTANGEIGLWDSSKGAGPAGFVDMGNITNQWQAQGIGDFDGDGKADVLWRYSNGEVGLWESTKGAGAASFVDLGNVSETWQIQGTGDFDGDGKADVLWRNSNGEVGLWESSKGLNSANFIDLGNVSTAWHVAGIGDFDGDGKSDILWRNSNGEVGLWESSKGLNSANFVDLGNVSTAWQAAGVGDFDGDGKSDVLWVNSSNGDLALWDSAKGLNAGGLVQVGQLGAHQQVMEVADLNGDGLSDILLHNTATGDVTALVSNGSSLTFTAHDLGVAPTAWQPAVDLHIV